jgi:hypothetical protein
MATTKRRKTGPRGGKTTVSKSGLLVRKAFLIGWEENDALRLASFETGLAEADLVRRALRSYFKLPVDPPGNGD